MVWAYALVAVREHPRLQKTQCPYKLVVVHKGLMNLVFPIRTFKRYFNNASQLVLKYSKEKKPKPWLPDWQSMLDTSGTDNALVGKAKKKNKIVKGEDPYQFIPILDSRVIWDSIKSSSSTSTTATTKKTKSPAVYDEEELSELNSYAYTYRT